MSRQFDNSDDIIDSADIIERIEELESEMEDYQLDNRCKHLNLKSPSKKWKEWEGLEEYKILLNVAEQGEGYGDWEHGTSLIRDSYFREYAEEEAYDLGLVSRYGRWPVDCIDWERAAEDLKVDYTEIDFDGVTYWMRS